MGQILAQHWPHFGIVAVGLLVFLWVAFKPQGDELPAQRQEPAPRPAPAPNAVRRSVARRGLLALGPLLGTVATGAILYGVDVAGDSPPGAVIWVHSGISALALLLVVYKVADLGVARIRRAFSRQNLHELVSIVLGALSVPLLVTGIALLFAPSTRSSMAYLHLISSAWWTGLMLWHLRRYMGASFRSAFSSRSPARAGKTATHPALAAIVAQSDPPPSPQA
jgi:FtsH-binding integral membrane protein